VRSVSIANGAGTGLELRFRPGDALHGHLAAGVRAGADGREHGAAAKVLEGAIKRGAGGSIRPVIWVSDLRNFTKMSDVLAPADMLVLLNAYFEAMASAVAAHGNKLSFDWGAATVNA
jgi:class 3 adenylate cyclase